MKTKTRMSKNVVRTWEDIPSSTNPAKKYTVLMYADGGFSCNCPRWTNALRCRTCGGFGETSDGAIVQCKDCNGSGRTKRNCTHIIGIKAVYRLEDIDAQIRIGRGIPIAKRHITLDEE